MMTRISKTTERLGDRLIQARTVLRVPPDNLARAARLDPARLATFEKNEYVPAEDELQRLADMLGRSPRELSLGPLTPMTDDHVGQVRLRIQRRQGGRSARYSPDEQANIAANLRLRREAMGRSQRDIGADLGIAGSTVTMHENPATSKFGTSEAVLIQYAEIFGCKVEDLLKPPPPKDQLASEPTLIYRGRWLGSEPPSPAVQKEIEAFERRIQSMAAKEKAKGKSAGRSKSK